MSLRLSRYSTTVPYQLSPLKKTKCILNGGRLAKYWREKNPRSCHLHRLNWQIRGIWTESAARWWNPHRVDGRPDQDGGIQRHRNSADYIALIGALGSEREGVCLGLSGNAPDNDSDEDDSAFHGKNCLLYMGPWLGLKLLCRLLEWQGKAHRKLVW